MMRRRGRFRFSSASAICRGTVGSQTTQENWTADSDAACFIAYYVARCNLRSLFTNTSQARPYDEICEALMQRCARHPQAANWWAIAHVLPTAEVLSHLDVEQKGVLLADYFNLMAEAARFLKELWESNELGEDMPCPGSLTCALW